MSKLRIGLIGCGRIAQAVHLPVLLSMPDVEIVAIAEPDEQRRAEAAARVPKAHATSNWQELLERSNATAVLICLPTHLHAQSATAALSQGIHVYLEKPLATSLDEASPVIDTWRATSNRVAMIGFNYRFNPLVVRAKEMLAASRIGRVIAVRSVFSHCSKSLPKWKQSRQTGGGVLLDLASHHADLVRFLLNDSIAQVTASVRSIQSEVDTATLEMRTASGVLVQSFFSSAALEEDSFEFIGTDGKLWFNRYTSVDVEHTPASMQHENVRRIKRMLSAPLRAPARIRKILARGNEPSYGAMLSRFVDAARNDRPTSPDLLDGLQSLAVIEAAEESARSGRAISVAAPVSSASPAATALAAAE